MAALLTLTRCMYPISSAHRVACVREPDPNGAPKPRLLERVRAAVRARHYSRRTEEAYVAWIRRSIFFHGKRHPAEMNQALSALLFLYRAVLDIDVPWMDDLVRA